MAQNYQFERASVAATGATPVTLLAAPPVGVSYRIFYINGFNNAGAARILKGQVVSVASGTYRCFRSASVNNNNQFVASHYTIALAEWPTIAVLDDTDETLEIFLSAAGTMVISVCYEIVDQTGERTFRNAFATTNGTARIELLAAPTPETVYRILMVNGLNDSGGNRTLRLDAGTGGTNRMATLFTFNNVAFWFHTLLNQAPWPPLHLSSTSDSLVMSMDAAGALNIAAYYEVLDRRVV